MSSELQTEEVEPDFDPEFDPQNVDRDRKEKSKPEKLRERLNAGEAFITNFKGDQAATWRFTASVTGGDAQKIADSLDKSIDIRYYYVHQIEMENSRTGELTSCVRTVFVTNGGEVFSAVSDGILNGLEIIREIFGDGPWSGEVVCRVKQVTTGSKQRTYNIVPAI